MGVRGIPHFDQQADAEPRIACPQVAQAVGAAPASCPGCRGPGGVQKNFAESLDEIAERDAAGKPIEVWFQDEARIGQKNKITRRWARRGTRPSAPHDQRTRSTYIFGAICPARGIAAGLILPRCNTAAMALHLPEISQTVTPGAHAVLLLDQAGWHLSAKLDIPDCRQSHPNSIRSKTSGSSCATTGSPIASSAPTTTSLSTAATPGTSSSTSPGLSCRSACATGHIGSNQRDLV